MDEESMGLVLVRHGQSEWNGVDLFTGWTDVDLTDEGRRQAAHAGRALADAGFDFDLCFTSYLKRSIHTLEIILDQMDRSWLPVMRSWRLNERHYGALQGLNKAQTAERYGTEQVMAWRRGFDVRPPLLSPGDERDPHLQAAYRDVAPDEIPMGESLQDTARRAWPYFESVIAPAGARRKARPRHRAQQHPARPDQPPGGARSRADRAHGDPHRLPGRLRARRRPDGRQEAAARVGGAPAGGAARRGRTGRTQAIGDGRGRAQAGQSWALRPPGWPGRARCAFLGPGWQKGLRLHDPEELARPHTKSVAPAHANVIAGNRYSHAILKRTLPA